MSRLGIALGAYPHISVITTSMAKEDEKLKQREAKIAQQEVVIAKRLQEIYPSLTWTSALKAANSIFIKETLVPVSPPVESECEIDTDG